MANTYVAPNFDIDTSCNVADLITLKGSAIATTDLIYISNAATVTAEQNLSILSFYFGDNVAGTAGTKTGHLIINDNVTVNLYHTTVHYGLYGEGSTSTITSSGTGSKITCNTPDKVTNYYISTCKIDFSAGGEIEHIYSLYMGAAGNTFPNTIFRDCYNAIHFQGSYNKLPVSMDGAQFIGCASSIYDLTAGTTDTIDWGDYFVINKIKLTGNSDGSSQFLLRFGTTPGISRYIRFESSAIPLHNKYRKGLKGISNVSIKNRN